MFLICKNLKCRGANRIGMAEADKFVRWYALLDSPIRQKILLKLGEYDKLSFDELLKEVKIDDQMQLYSELRILVDLVTKAKDNVVYRQEVYSNDISEKYMLTDEGHDVLDWMLYYPELAINKPKRQLETPTLLLLFFVPILITAVIYLLLVALGFHF